MLFADSETDFCDQNHKQNDRCYHRLRHKKPICFFTWNCSSEVEIVSLGGMKFIGTCL